MPYCTGCGGSLAERDRFCPQCGTKRRDSATPAASPPAVPSHDLEDAAGPVEPSALGAPRYGSMFSGEIKGDGNGTAVGGGGLPLVVMLVVGAVLVIVIGAAADWWFTRPTVSTERPQAAAAAETEQVIEPRGTRPRDVGQRDAVAPAPTSGDHMDDAAAGEWRVVADDTRDVKSAADVTAAPDGRTAVIGAGGALAIAWREDFYNGDGPDIRVYGPEGDRTPYTLFTRQEVTDRWMRFDASRRGFPSGTAAHDFGHHGIEATREILIRNDGAINLYIDAVTPLHT